MKANSTKSITRWTRSHFPWRTLLVLLILALYGFAFKEVDIRDVISALRKWAMTDILLLVLVNVLVLSAMCLRLWMILQRCGHMVSLGRLAVYRIAANAISIITPGPHFGGEPFQIHMLIRRHRLPIEHAAASVVTDRAIEMVANLGLLCAGGLYLYHLSVLGNGLHIQIFTILLLILVSACVFLKVVADGRAPLSLFFRQVCAVFKHKPLRSSWGASLATGEKKVGEILKQPLPILLLYGGCAVIQWLLMAVEFWLIYAVIGTPLEPGELVAVVVAARIAFLLPLPGALGVLEASQVLILGSLNLPPIAGIAACMVMRARDLLMVTAGVGLSSFWLGVGWPLKNKLNVLDS